MITKVSALAVAAILNTDVEFEMHDINYTTCGQHEVHTFTHEPHVPSRSALADIACDGHPLEARDRCEIVRSPDGGTTIVIVWNEE